MRRCSRGGGSEPECGTQPELAQVFLGLQGGLAFGFSGSWAFLDAGERIENLVGTLRLDLARGENRELRLVPKGWSLAAGQ